MKTTLSGVEQTSIIKNNGNEQYTSFPADEDNQNYANFKKDLADGAELQDADGKVIDGTAYLKELA